MVEADTSHPSPRQLRMNPSPSSFTAIRGLYDKCCTKYTAVATTQSGEKLLISGFDDIAWEITQAIQRKE